MKNSILIIFIFSSLLYADTIYLSNSNTIKGSIIFLDENIIKIKTDNGILEVQKDKIVRAEILGNGIEISGNLVFDFQINGNIKDTSGNSYIIKTKSIPYTTDSLGYESGALQSNGTGQYFYIENSKTISDIDEFTIAMSFFPEDTSENTFLISNWENTFKDFKADGRFSLSVKNRNLAFYVVDSNGYYQSIAASNIINLNQWNVVAIRFGKGKMSLFVNGKSAVEKTISTNSLLKGNWPIYFLTAKYVNKQGVDYKYYNFKGKLDNIKMFDSTLSDNELNLLYKL